MANVGFKQVTSYPATPDTNTLYFLKRVGSIADLRLTDTIGAYYDIASDSKTLGTVLAGFSANNAAITAADSILVGFNKAQGQISANASAIALKANITSPTFQTSVSINGYQDFTEISAPATPAPGGIRLWAEDHAGFTHLHFKDSNALVYEIGSDNIYTVRNNSGSTIPKGSWVYITGSNGQYPTIGLARANSINTVPVAGIVVAEIANNAFGQIMSAGDAQNINTSAFADGAVLYLSSATAGLATTTPPSGTDIIQRIGVVVKGSAGAGIINVLIGGEFNPTLTQTLTNKTLTSPIINSPTGIIKSDVGLGNVDNTSDINKPVSTAQALADASILSSAQLYADGLVVGLWDDRGSYDPTATSTYPASGGSGTAGAILKGDIWTVSVAGTIAGITVQIGDLVRALVNTPGTTAANWSISETNIGYVPENVASKDASGGYAGLTLFKINFKNALNTLTSFFTNANTASRTYTFADRDGTIADDTDITNAKNRANHTGTQTASTISDFNSAALSAAPAETTTTIGALINGATDKATPVDGDYVGLMDSAASNILKKLSWANIKATLKTYFDTLYNFNTIADFTIPPASNQTAQGPRTNDLNAGATTAIMDLLILNSSSQWVKTDANTLSLYAGMLSVGLAAGSSGNPLNVALKGSIIRNDSWNWTPGAVLYMSETAGEITETQPSTADVAIRVVGFAITADVINFDPSPDYIVHT